MTQIVYLSNARIPTEKAHGIQICKMCEAFADSGAEVTLTHPYRVQPPSLRGVDPFAYYRVRRNVALRQLPSLDLHHVLSGRLERFWFPLQAGSNALASFVYALPHYWDPHTVLYSRDRQIVALLLAFRPWIQARLVYEAHTFPERSRRWFVPLLRRVDCLVVITQQLKRLFLENGLPAEKVVVAPDAVDLERFQIADSRPDCRRRLGLPAERPIVGYVGRFHTMGMEKGIPDLIQAMKGLLSDFADRPPLLLCVGGPMECVPAYQALARQHGVPLAHLRFVDRVPHSEVPYWMRACDVLTIPFPWNEHMAYYTSPMKLFEYMAVGTPIVASDLPSLREILEPDRNAVLVSPDDPRSLAAGIRRVLEDRAFARRLAAQALEDVQEYTWKKRARRILGSLGIADGVGASVPVRVNSRQEH